LNFTTKGRRTVKRGRKIQNDLLKNEIKRRQLKFYAKNYDENYQFRKEIESKGSKLIIFIIIFSIEF
jgi:hypothetical protein